MEMIEVEVSELSGPALDWAVAKACHDARVHVLDGCVIYDEFVEQYGDVYPVDYSPSTDWSQGGPLIERHHVDVTFERSGHWWSCTCDEEGIPTARHGPGHTALIAASRAIVFSKLGDTVQVPKELVP